MVAPRIPKIGQTRRKSKELWYVVGAWLGDGYTSSYQKEYIVGLDVRSKTFAEKFAAKESKIFNRPVKAHYYRGNRIWFVRIKNRWLFRLLNEFRRRPRDIMKHIDIIDFVENGLQFLEGFFDAEGCVKVIKERVRKTPKICLDVTNTRVEILRVFNEIMARTLRITGHYSTQLDSRANRKAVFHLRVYRKREIACFLRRVKTIKLTDSKRPYVYNWLHL